MRCLGATGFPAPGQLHYGASGSRRDFAHFMRLLAYLLATGFVNVTIRASSRVAGQLDRAVVGVLLVLLVVQVIHVWRLWRRSVHGDIGGSIPA